MEINFDTVRALSSPTRVKILNQVLEKEATPTQLSNNLDKSKSTVSSHLSTLQEAGLVEKDAVEGRKRVTYQPTTKAENIIRGREKKVKFSFCSSAVSALAGVAIGGYALTSRMSYKSADATTQSEQLSAMTTEGSMGAMDAAKTATESSGIDLANIMFSSEVLLGVGVFFIGLAIASFVYGWTMNKLGN